MPRRVLLFALVGGLVFTVKGYSADHPKAVSKAEAMELIRMAVPAKIRQLPKFGLEQYSDLSRLRFYFYTAYWAGLPNGSVITGHYAVDGLTGDVWDAVMSCKKESNRALRKRQAELRSLIGLSRSEYVRIKTKGPHCE